MNRSCMGEVEEKRTNGADKRRELAYWLAASRSPLLPARGGLSVYATGRNRLHRHPRCYQGDGSMVGEQQRDPFLRLILTITELIESVISVRHGEGGKWCSTEPVWGELTTDINWQLLPHIANNIKNIMIRVYVVIDLVFFVKLRFLAWL